jgi:anti-sigma regulatory factor (Ser/Thr protein kinase)
VTELGSETFEGLPEAAGLARRFVRDLLGNEHPARDDAELLTGEVFANAVRHSASAEPGGKVAVGVYAEGSEIRIAITDDGGAGPLPQVRNDLYGESGRGLFLLDMLAIAWGVRLEKASTTVWFRVTADAQGPSRPE